MTGESVALRMLVSTGGFAGGTTFIVEGFVIGNGGIIGANGGTMLDGGKGLSFMLSLLLLLLLLWIILLVLLLVIIIILSLIVLLIPLEIVAGPAAKVELLILFVVVLMLSVLVLMLSVVLLLLMFMKGVKLLVVGFSCGMTELFGTAPGNVGKTSSVFTGIGTKAVDGGCAATDTGTDGTVVAAVTTTGSDLIAKTENKTCR